MKKLSLFFLNLLLAFALHAEDGYSLWLWYQKISNASLLTQYRSEIKGVSVSGASPTLSVAREELLRGLDGLLGQSIKEIKSPAGIIYIGTDLPDPSTATKTQLAKLKAAAPDAYFIQSVPNKAGRNIAIVGNTDKGVLYGVFHFLRLLQTHQSVKELSILSAPKIQHRILNHWDNLNRTVERGYAGFSIWDWHKLPDYIDQRYIDYARANASIGINGTVLTNVNANALVLTEPYLEKVAALAKVFRSYGIQVYLTARFSAPIEIDGLKIADPLDKTVQGWWKRKTAEIYQRIPDFGGFLVKANSEGQPGPQNYGRNHADGANMLADAVAPFGGIVMWRAFVRGLQGNDPKYLKAAACAKHYAVHSGPEPLRHVFNVAPSAYTLWNTYQPAFKELVVNANVRNQYCWEGAQGFKTEYFNNRDLSGTPVLTYTEEAIAHNWQEGEYVVVGIHAYNFSVRWTTDFRATSTGDITFEVEAADGYRFLVDGKEVINAWTRNRWGARTYKLLTEAGKTYRLTLEYYQGEGKASAHLWAGHFVPTNFNALADRVKDADVTIFAGGITPQLEGEEMQVNAAGFHGGDRTSTLLLEVQTRLMKTLKATGKLVVFVLITGSAIAIPWEAENIPAIINAWYGGQEAGTAIADVLFGDYNPAGRLPLTFYRSDSDLPDFNDYSMDNRTYRYFKGKPLYGFGYGLSYTKFTYKALKVPTSVRTGSKVPVSVRVTNSGKKEGEEVVQLYITNEGAAMKVPVRELRGFKRILLKAGESKVIQFDLSPEQISIADEKGHPVQPKGKLRISVGGSQSDASTIKNKKTTEAVVEVL